MCTPQEAYDQSVQAIEDVLFSKEDGKSRIEREVEAFVFGRFGRWALGGGVVFIISVAGLYFDLLSDVKSNTMAIHEGGRYTQEEADVDNANFQRQIDEMNKKLDIIIEQTRS